jgi:ppGpp synthetase/RelA/SpoT-type nucleotidyltranferase
LEGYPTAKVWDDESRKYFEEIGIRTEPQSRMYSSVHYVITSNSRFKLTGEIQVRTLAQELWGEVDHKINYPHAHPSVSCREQIRTLAWVANSCTRLVDSIFSTHAAEEARDDRVANDITARLGVAEKTKPKANAESEQN